ncbi:Serine/threonine-protein kinase, partial [Coemansia aciculifera]
MFQPLLDVTAVGALIDTFAEHRPVTTPVTLPATPKPAAVSDTDGPKQRIIGGLRRATTVISSNRHKLKMLRRRKSTDMLSAIESLQNSEHAPSPDAAPAPAPAPPSPPPPTNRVRRAGTLNILPSAQAAAAATPPPLKRTPTQTNSSAAASIGYTPIAVSLKSTRSRQFLLNTPLGEFEVIRTLGQGSYGKVKLMRSALTAEQFAVKIIKRYPPYKHRRGHAEYRKAKTLDRRVVREANLAAILGQLHPHIVPLHDFRVTDTHFYLFYAYVDGVTLAERVGSGGLSECEARAVFKPVVETIRFCHQYSVIHRDIKLENVLIDYADEAQDAWPLLGRGNASAPGASQQQQQQQRPLAANLHNNQSASNLDVSSSSPADYRSASVFEGRIKIIDFGLANFFDGTSLMET